MIIGAIKERDNAKTHKNTLSERPSIKSLSTDEKNVVKITSKNLSISVNSKDGYVTLSAKMPEPILAAELAQRGQELLQEYITEFKIEKVASNLKFVEKSYEESKKNFEAKQVELAKFRDSNKSFSTSVAKTQEEKLTSEYNLLLGIYTELAKQKEQAKIAVTETTPILTILEPVVIPSQKSKPSRPLILLIYTSIGMIISIGLIFIILYIENNFSKNINQCRFMPKIL